MSNSELGTFLRARREAIGPGDVGLPSGTRRRTPGLRRAELATLAGISVEYLTRLEQGRDRHPSPQVLGALGDALRLSADDRLLLVQAAKTAGGIPCLGASDGPPARSVRPTVQALLDRLEPTPAYVANRLGDVLAYTGGYEGLAGPLGVLDGRMPNLARFLFTDPRARTAYPDWERVASEVAARLAFAAGRHDRHAAGLVEELTVTGGAAFADRLNGSSGSTRTGVLRLVHPDVGELRLAYETLELPDADDQSLIVYLPADEATSAALDRLSGRRSGALRVVSG